MYSLLIVSMIQSAGNKLEKAIARQIEKIDYFCTAGNVSSNLAVHELRKSFKRLRAWFRFYIGISGGRSEKVIEEIRHFGKLLAPVRESFVNIDLLEREIKGHKFIPERKIRTAREKMILHNKNLIGESFCNNEICVVIKEFFSGFESYFDLGDSIKITKAGLFREVSNSYLQSFSRYENLTGDSSADEFHSLRKKLKQLFYQLDFIRFIHPRYFRLKTDQLNRINDQLGNDHDFFVFINELTSGDYDFTSEEIFILENQVEHLSEINRIKLFPRLKQFFVAVPDEFDQKTEQFFRL